MKNEDFKAAVSQIDDAHILDSIDFLDKRRSRRAKVRFALLLCAAALALTTCFLTLFFALRASDSLPQTNALPETTLSNDKTDDKTDFPAPSAETQPASAYAPTEQSTSAVVFVDLQSSWRLDVAGDTVTSISATGEAVSADALHFDTMRLDDVLTKLLSEDVPEKPDEDFTVFASVRTNDPNAAKDLSERIENSLKKARSKELSHILTADEQTYTAQLYECAKKYKITPEKADYVIRLSGVAGDEKTLSKMYQLDLKALCTEYGVSTACKLKYTQWEAFTTLCDSLGVDPDNTPITRYDYAYLEEQDAILWLIGVKLDDIERQYAVNASTGEITDAECPTVLTAGEASKAALEHLGLTAPSDTNWTIVTDALDTTYAVIIEKTDGQQIRVLVYKESGEVLWVDYEGVPFTLIDF